MASSAASTSAITSTLSPIMATATSTQTAHLLTTNATVCIVKDGDDTFIPIPGMEEASLKIFESQDFPVSGRFSVAFDPLDGSNIVDTNFTVGTIFGVWLGDKLTRITGRNQVVAAKGFWVLEPCMCLLLRTSRTPMNFFYLMKVRFMP
ncbi:uncharacterized protein LOC109803716 [Cajanus cajan]|uniref:uncharacterized protein LOC109803716 n=1 Tax=Cajanus cajan TaxID=3821 RepID=UPI00098D7D77|nr:uncharacterized protein LOC109803716 [Cajanus cajan]